MVKNARNLRLVYDIVVLITAALMTIALTGLYRTLNIYECLIVVSMGIIVFFGLKSFGIYSTRRKAGFKTKALLIVMAYIIACVSVALIFFDIRPTLFFAAFGLPLQIIPRFILQPQSSSIGMLMQKTVTEKGDVLIIGGAGYIGSLVVEQLIEKGKKVRVLDKLMYGNESIKDFIGNENFSLIEGDCTNVAALTKAMHGCGSVIHLAGLVGDPACAVDPIYTRHTNIIATRMVRDVALSLGVKRFIFSSSCSVYGVSDAEVSEEGELKPVSLYAETKVDSERELLSSIPDDFVVTILRFATVFGDSRRPRFDLVANVFSAQAVVNKKITVIGPDQWRPFVHVKDLARAICLVLEAPEEKVNGQVFNTGDKRLNCTIGQLGETVKKITTEMGVESDLTVEQGNSADKRNYAVSFEKIKSTLGFESATLLDEGVREMVVKLQSGEYGEFTDSKYSNLKTTKYYKDLFYSDIKGERIATINVSGE